MSHVQTEVKAVAAPAPYGANARTTCRKNQLSMEPALG